MSRTKTIRTFIAAALMTLGAPAMMMTACGGDDVAALPEDDDNQVTGAGGGGGDQPGICLLNNCNSNQECAGCGDGRNTCLVEENRCVACNPTTGEGCGEGEECSAFGLCVPQGLTCPTDEHGTPTVTCTQNTDCLACSPMHQVCDTATGQCQACTETNTQHCLQSDVCVDGACSAKCPGSCTVDNDCSSCGSPGNEAHACNAHECAECSDTYPCPAGLECVSGSCIPGCGIPGPKAGDCLADEDCQYCGDATDPSNSWECKKPINQNGPGDHGTCGPAATGCSDLGNGVAVLPEPWSDVTNLCSSDGDCAGVGIQFNVGEAIRDLVGSDEIDLGFTEIEIQDALVSYDMSKCADINLTENISCGVCVPCEVDADCQPIAVDTLVMDLFSGDPLAQIAGAVLIDLLWGNNPDHDLNFYCQPVAAGYGVCAPCSNPLQACGSNQGGGGGGGGTCGHDVCTAGDALGTSCDSCAAQVCQNDPYCCDTAWDSVCVSEVAQYCGATTCQGGGNSNCAHSECAAGNPLTASCSTCAQSVCAADSYCCDTAWDNICVGLVDQHCGANTCQGGGGNNTPCAHSECTVGDKLTASCSSCAQSVCAADSYCCNTSWDQTCVDLVPQVCGANTCGGSSCAHDECSSGPKLDATCSTCASQVCQQDAYCCDNEWDSVCVGIAEGISSCGC